MRIQCDLGIGPADNAVDLIRIPKAHLSAGASDQVHRPRAADLRRIRRFGARPVKQSVPAWRWVLSGDGPHRIGQLAKGHVGVWGDPWTQSPVVGLEHLWGEQHGVGLGTIRPPDAAHDVTNVQ